MITYGGHFIGHRALAFIIMGTRRIPTTTTYKLASVYSHSTLTSIINSSLCFNVQLTNSHGHNPSKQVYVLSPCVPSTVWTQNKEDSKLFLIKL